MAKEKKQAKFIKRKGRSPSDELQKERTAVNKAKRIEKEKRRQSECWLKHQQDLKLPVPTRGRARFLRRKPKQDKWRDENLAATEAA